MSSLSINSWSRKSFSSVVVLESSLSKVQCLATPRSPNWDGDRSKAGIGELPHRLICTAEALAISKLRRNATHRRSL